jgi:hypothetical protein
MSGNSASLKRRLNEVRKDPAKLSELQSKLNVAVASLPGLKGQKLTYLLNDKNKSNSTISSGDILLSLQYLILLLAEDKTPVPEVVKRQNDGPIKIAELEALIKVLITQVGGDAEFAKKAQDFLTFSKTVGAVNFKNVPNNHKNFAMRVYEEITKPKIMVFLNPGGAPENRDPLVVSRDTGSNNNIKALADSNNYINVVRPGMDFRKFKDANKTSVVMSIGSSGAGKSYLLGMLDKSGMYGKRKSMSYYAPSIQLVRTGPVTEQVVSLNFTSDTSSIQNNNAFNGKYIKPSPFNPASSRAHKLITYENGDIIVDLCGTESAIDISTNALGFNLFKEDIFKLRANEISPAIKEGLKEAIGKDGGFGIVTGTGDMAVKNFKRAFGINKGNHPDYNVGTLDGPDFDTIRLKHAIACGIVKVWAKKHKSTKKVVEITSNDIISKLKPEYKERLLDKTAYKEPIAATYYAFQILSRCLEGLWISRTLDELALIYNAADRIKYFDGAGPRGWSTSSSYDIPAGMTHNNNTYTVKLENLKAEGSNPFALGVGNTKTPISKMISDVEPKFKKNKLNNGEKADTTQNLHRMVVLLRYTKGETLGNIHKSVLTRIKGWAKLKATVAGKAVNTKPETPKKPEDPFNTGLVRFFTNGKNLLSAQNVIAASKLGPRSTRRVGRAFNPTGKSQTFPGLTEFNANSQVVRDKIDKFVGMIKPNLGSQGKMSMKVKMLRLAALIYANYMNVSESKNSRNMNAKGLQTLYSQIRDEAKRVLATYFNKLPTKNNTVMGFDGVSKRLGTPLNLQDGWDDTEQAELVQAYASINSTPA